MLTTDEYLRSCYNHLSSVRVNEDGSESPYYCKSDNKTLDQAKSEILSVLKEAKDQDIITADDFEAMDPTEKGPGRFYQLFKVHKQHQEGHAPPELSLIHI